MLDKLVNKKILQACTANIIIVLSNLFAILMLPKYMYAELYGQWQLFLFYFSYVGFLHFGWEDGIYLRYAGLNYYDLDKSKLLGQVIAIIGSQCLLGIVIFSLVNAFMPTGTQGDIFRFIAVALILANTNNLFSFIFQMTSRISEYARIIAIEPLIFISLVIIVLFLGERDYKILVYCKLASLSVACIFGGYLLSDLSKASIPSALAIFYEAKYNLSVGSKLMLANIASMLVIGIVRFGISDGWDVVTFGKISLTLSISNFLMIFINAVSVVLLPALKHVEEELRQHLYLAGRSLLTAGMLLMLLSYYPLNGLLSLWLPQYTDALNYMAVLFPVCLFETRMGLLVSTYLKAMRQEKLMLKINTVSVLFSLLITIFTVNIIHNLTACIVSIVIIFAFRCFFAEKILYKLLNCCLIGDITKESIVIVVFMISAWFIGGLAGALVYMVILGLYLANNIKTLKKSIKLLNSK